MTDQMKLQYAKYINSARWKNIRDLMLKRAKNKCEKCGSASRLEVHHKTYDRFGKESINDLTVLCKPCHKSEDEKRAADGKIKSAKALSNRIYENGLHTFMEKNTAKAGFFTKMMAAMSLMIGLKRSGRKKTVDVFKMNHEMADPLILSITMPDGTELTAADFSECLVPCRAREIPGGVEVSIHGLRSISIGVDGFQLRDPMAIAQTALFRDIRRRFDDAARVAAKNYIKGQM